MKLEETVKCPYCGKEDIYIFYDNTKMLECDNCGKPMDIKLEVKTIVTTKKPIRICEICGSKFESDTAYDDSIICPICNNKTENYNYTNRS